MKFFNLVQKYLVPPGNGVYTVHTAKDKREGLHQKIYNTNNEEEVFNLWKNNLKNIDKNNIVLLGICSDTGGGIIRGANWGPLFIREKLYAHNLNNNFFDLGDVRVIPHLLHDKYLNIETIKACQRALYGEENNLAVSPLSITEKFVEEFYKNYSDKILVSIGGDHSVSYPLVKEYLKSRKAFGKRAALLHFDAHTDLLKERLGIDLCFGSWVSHILEYLDEPDLAVQVGIRSTGKDKKYWEGECGVKQIWQKDIDTDGAVKVAQQIVEHFKSKKIDELYISFDIDALDFSFAAATGTPEHGGMQLSDAVEIIKVIKESFLISGADLVEVAPFVNNFSDKPEPATTLNSGFEILKSILFD